MENLWKTHFTGRVESIRTVSISLEMMLDTLDALRTLCMYFNILTASHLSEEMLSFEFYLAALLMCSI